MEGKIAILDLGTNTFNLLIAEVAPGGSYVFLRKTKEIVKLAEGSDDLKSIAERPFRRGLDAIKKLALICKDYDVHSIYAFGTSAIRSASNGADFIQQIKIKTGINVNILSGSDEAKLIYEGVKNSMDLGADKSLIMDIGGGSIEFIIANRDEIFWHQSLEVGAARLLQQFSPSDPIKISETEAIHNYLQTAFTPVFLAAKEHGVSCLVGSSGAFSTFAKVVGFKYRDSDIWEKNTFCEIEIPQFHEIYNSFLSSNSVQISEMKGMAVFRIEMISISAICTHAIIKAMPIRKLMVSKFALKEGILSNLMSQSHPTNVLLSSNK